MSKMIVALAIGLVLGWVIHSLFTIWGVFDRSSKFHLLDRPITLYFEDGSKVNLPEQTALHFEKSFPEGYSRYYIYLKIEGAPLDLEQSKFQEVRPILAGFEDKEEPE